MPQLPARASNKKGPKLLLTNRVSASRKNGNAQLRIRTNTAKDVRHGLTTSREMSDIAERPKAAINKSRFRADDIQNCADEMVQENNGTNPIQAGISSHFGFGGKEIK